jgi:hypothetical protein
LDLWSSFGDVFLFQRKTRMMMTRMSMVQPDVFGVEVVKMVVVELVEKVLGQEKVMEEVQVN